MNNEIVLNASTLNASTSDVSSEIINTPTPICAKELNKKHIEKVDFSSSPFAKLGLIPNILQALVQVGYNCPTPVQTQAIPACLAGRDLMVSSQTGSGKTAAFMLPALQLIAGKNTQDQNSQLPINEAPNYRQNDRARHDKAQRIKGQRPKPAAAKPSILVLTPTRELALQVTQACVTYGKYLRRIECGSILGGMPYPKQLLMLSRMPDILVATPGRLLDHIGANRIDLSLLQMLVFDEADRMLDMGFSDDIDAILKTTPEVCQTVMFSATINARVAQLAGRMLKNPLRIEISGATVSHEHIEQRLHYTDDMRHKQQLLTHLLSDTDLKQAIVFTSTKRGAESLSEHLSHAGFAAGALHGDMHQGARNRTLGELRRGNLRILVATDVAARGIDVPDITHVVNFDLPKVAEDYIHRIGRTGRAGRNGIAISLVDQIDIMLWQRIERIMKRRISASVIQGMEPRKTISESSYRRNDSNRNYRGGKSEGYRGNSSNSRPYSGNSGNSFSSERRNSSFSHNSSSRYAANQTQGNVSSYRRNDAVGDKRHDLSGNNAGNSGGRVATSTYRSYSTYSGDNANSGNQGPSVRRFAGDNRSRFGR